MGRTAFQEAVKERSEQTDRYRRNTTSGNSKNDDYGRGL